MPVDETLDLNSLAILVCYPIYYISKCPRYSSLEKKKTKNSSQFVVLVVFAFRFQRRIPRIAKLIVVLANVTLKDSYPVSVRFDFFLIH